MQILHRDACKTRVPLNPPRMIAGIWCAMCPECLTEHRLVPITPNVFLPMRFRVAEVVSGAHALGALLRREM